MLIVVGNGLIEVEERGEQCEIYHSRSNSKYQHSLVHRMSFK